MTLHTEHLFIMPIYPSKKRFEGLYQVTLRGTKLTLGVLDAKDKSFTPKKLNHPLDFRILHELLVAMTNCHSQWFKLEWNDRNLKEHFISAADHERMQKQILSGDIY